LTAILATSPQMLTAPMPRIGASCNEPRTDVWHWPTTRRGVRYASIADIRLWLVANRLWTDLEQLIQQVLLYGAIPPTVVQDGRVYAVAAHISGGADAPLRYLELAESQTALSGCIEHVTWRDQQLEAHGWAFIRGLDLGSETPELTAELVEPITGCSYPCDVTQLQASAANEWAGFRYQDVASGGFIVGIDTQRIDWMAGRWQLRLTVRAHGLERTGPIQAVAPGGAGHLMWGRNLRGADDTFRVVRSDPQLGLCSTSVRNGSSHSPQHRWCRHRSRCAAAR
jgi:hypothetical protein